MSLVGTILALIIIAALIGIFPIVFLLKQLIWLVIGVAVVVLVVRLIQGERL